jgi:hypothetical protein
MSDCGPIRLTLDTNLRATETKSIRFANVAHREIAPGIAILEMKYRVHVPALFKRLIAEFGLASRSHSKYRTAIRGLGLVSQENRVVLSA